MVAVLLCLALLALPASAQEVTATARVDSGHILIGDWLGLHIDVVHPEGVTVAFPILPDSLEGIQVLKRGTPVKSSAAGKITESQLVTITAFDTGMRIVPPIPIQYMRGSDTTKLYAKTGPVVFDVGTLAVDTSKEIKDIKPPLSPGLTLADLLPYIIALVVIGIIVWVIRYVLKRRRTGVTIIPEAPPKPAYETAIEALRRLEAEQVWQRGLVKQYYSELTDIVRVYIERRYSVMAMEMTSDEILSSVSVAALPRELREPLKEILLRADLVKFAKYEGDPRENESSIVLARNFVEGTKPRAEGRPAEAAAPAAPAAKTEVGA